MKNKALIASIIELVVISAIIFAILAIGKPHNHFEIVGYDFWGNPIKEMTTIMEPYPTDRWVIAIVRTSLAVIAFVARIFLVKTKHRKIAAIISLFIGLVTAYMTLIYEGTSTSTSQSSRSYSSDRDDYSYSSSSSSYEEKSSPTSIYQDPNVAYKDGNTFRDEWGNSVGFDHDNVHYNDRGERMGFRAGDDEYDSNYNKIGYWRDDTLYDNFGNEIAKKDD